MTQTQPEPEPRTTGALRIALEREHRAIDGGVEDFASGRGGLHDAEQHLRDALAALRRHIYLEEEFLFPPLRESGMMAPIFVMLAEHRELWRTMDRLVGQLDEGTTLTDQRATASTLLAMLDRHNTKEEPIIYSQADVVLSEDARAELADFIDNEELPQGWVCEGA